jgi:hypothetical protein
MRAHADRVTPDLESAAMDDAQSVTSIAQSLTLSSLSAFSSVPTEIDLTSADPEDLVFVGAVRICDSCEEPSDSVNPLYRCTLLKKSKLVLATKRTAQSVKHILIPM